MRRNSLLGLLVPLLVVLHFLLHVGFSMEGAAPDLLTLALLLAARETGMGWAGAFGFFFGLLEDAFSVLAFGASSLAMTVVGVLGSRTRDLFVGDSLFFLFVYFALGKLLRDSIHWVVAGEVVRGSFLTTVIFDGGIAALYMASMGLVLALILGSHRALR